jgi:hypothetical protein
MVSNWEVEYLKKEEAITSDSGTIYIDLPKGEQIGNLMIDISATRTSTVDLLGTILDLPTKIDILLNGSKLAFGAEPEVASYFYFLAMGKLPPHQLSQRGTTHMRLPILFGRHYHDEKYLLDTSQYKSAQIQIPYSLNTTYYGTGTLKVTAWYERPRAPLAPEGFIRQRTIQSESRSATAGEFKHDLPTDYPVLDIGFRAFDIDAFLINVITDVKLDINSGKEIVFDGRIEDLLMLQELLFGMIHGYEQWMRPKSGDTVATQMGHVDRQGIWGTSASAWADILNCAAHWGPQATLTITQPGGTTRDVAGDWWIYFDGVAPHSCLDLLHAPKDEPYPLNEKAEGKVVYTQGAYAHTLETFVREVVKGVLS